MARGGSFGSWKSEPKAMVLYMLADDSGTKWTPCRCDWLTGWATVAVFAGKTPPIGTRQPQSRRIPAFLPSSPLVSILNSILCAPQLLQRIRIDVSECNRWIPQNSGLAPFDRISRTKTMHKHLPPHLTQAPSLDVCCCHRPSAAGQKRLMRGARPARHSAGTPAGTCTYRHAIVKESIWCLPCGTRPAARSSCLRACVPARIIPPANHGTGFVFCPGNTTHSLSCMNAPAERNPQNSNTLAPKMRQPRIERGAHRWQRWILPLNH
ncbi:hypothetical protein BT67DRAFT_232262 [Trichocladium antarcticum]|uniref:Uncharacterized protein n=1 Tax=Trichocladium antarcticum TaxID=1450529 RepID=A0AAN6UQP7_9PEZI|nr:hypothetical protein BT67DRAFT_232262 [Trichocladium antarcticum]